MSRINYHHTVLTLNNARAITDAPGLKTPSRTDTKGPSVKTRVVPPPPPAIPEGNPLETILLQKAKPPLRNSSTFVSNYFWEPKVVQLSRLFYRNGTEEFILWIILQTTHSWHGSRASSKHLKAMPRSNFQIITVSNPSNGLTFVKSDKND